MMEDRPPTGSEQSVETSGSLSDRAVFPPLQSRKIWLALLGLLLLALPLILVNYAPFLPGETLRLVSIGASLFGVVTVVAYSFIHFTKSKHNPVYRLSWIEIRYWLNHLLTVWILAGGICLIAAGAYLAWSAHYGVLAAELAQRHGSSSSPREAVLPSRRPSADPAHATPIGGVSAPNGIDTANTDQSDRIVHHYIQHSRLTTIFQIYVTIAGALLTLKVLVYRNLAPIVDVEELLMRLREDLKANTKAGARLWIVFPALNIGYYRYLPEIMLNQQKHIYRQYASELNDCAERLGQRAVAVTYTDDHCRKLFTCYTRANNPGTPEGVAKAKMTAERCTEEAIKLCHAGFPWKPGEVPPAHSSPAGTHVEIEPNEFPQPVIVIGNVVYIILSYGLPFYDSEVGDFQAIQGEHRVEVIVTRHEDSVLADMIENHLKTLVNDRLKRQRKTRLDTGCTDPMPTGSALGSEPPTTE